MTGSVSLVQDRTGLDESSSFFVASTTEISVCIMCFSVLPVIRIVSAAVKFCHHVISMAANSLSSPA